MDEVLWTKKDVAKFLRRSISSIDHAVCSRKIPYLKVSRHVRFNPEEVRAWVAGLSVRPIGEKR
jgi:hypothetical protein